VAIRDLEFRKRYPDTAEHRLKSGTRSGYETLLKILMVALFLPQGFSFLAGNVRLTVARALLIILSVAAIAKPSDRRNSHSSAFVPSDLFALMAGGWMILAGTIMSGISIGIKSGGVSALEFTGTYYVFRRLLGPVDSSVRVIRFSCSLMVFVVALALLDPLSGRMVIRDLSNSLGVYVVPYVLDSSSYFRNGLVRAVGPMEHSILFASACAWFAILTPAVFKSRFFSAIVIGVMTIGIWFSQARGPLLALLIAMSLAMFNSVTHQFPARWKSLGTVAMLGIGFICVYSQSPLATLMKYSLVDDETRWYREAIWQTAGPLVLESPLFGLGVDSGWDWQSHDVLAGSSVDAFWLKSAMDFGIPGSVLVFLTIVGAFFVGAINKSSCLSEDERRLSVALGFVTTTVVFLGFTVDLWGTCWILTAAFAGIRASLVEIVILGNRAAKLEVG